MCLDENCLPLCSRWNHLDDPYCKERGQGLYASSAGRGPRGERVELTAVAKPVWNALLQTRSECAVGDRYIAGGEDTLMCRILGLFGMGCKTELQRAQECVDYLKATTGGDHYVDTQFEIRAGETFHYYRVLEGKR